MGHSPCSTSVRCAQSEGLNEKLFLYAAGARVCARICVFSHVCACVCVYVRVCASMYFNFNIDGLGSTFSSIHFVMLIFE